jgi:serine/threonine protein kinase
VWLERLHKQVLPMLDEWVTQLGRVREEREDLSRHAERPSTDKLHALHEAWNGVTDVLEDRLGEENKAKRRLNASHAADAAIEATRQARRDVQCAQRALHVERTRLAQVAAAHFPELFAMEPLLKLGAAEGVDSDELRRVLVERELTHYDDRVRISKKDGRHEVWRASYAGDGAKAELCVLKEYKLNDASEWKALLKEVKLLGQLSECQFIASVDAVFVVYEPSYAAYVQLPYYNGGDMLHWLNGTVPEKSWLELGLRNLGLSDRRSRRPEVWQRKVLLGQLCEALRHLHSHGLAHGDVKLENVLVSLEGERATAHLADFESARRQQAKGARNSLRASTVGGIAFTELYVAPEILKASREGRERDAKPTAMGDMFSYGVCCLFACCLPPTAEEQQKCIRRFDVEDDRMLSAWSREAAKQADAHLLDLLESLLADAATSEEALARRLSASQTLRHAFLDTAAALELSTKAQQAAAKASQEAEQQMAAVEQEAARRDREAAWREAEQRRRQAEQEEALEAALKQSELEAAAKRNEIQREQRRLEEWRQNVREQQAEAETKARAAWQLTSDAKREATQERAQAQKRRKELEAEEKRVALECARRKAEAESAEAKAAKERDELRVARTIARVMPDYWEKRLAAGSPDGFAAIALDRTGCDLGTCAALEKLLQTDPVKLKRPGIDRSGTTHDRLKLACAWRLENPVLWEKYMVNVQGVMLDMKRIQQGGVTAAGGAPPLTRGAADALPGHTRADVNEAFLMHGTSAGVLFNILSTGLNERFAGTAAGAVYGEGSYLAEDAGKNDQYTKVDSQYDGSSELHKRLYAHGARHHPGKVFYILVCRVALGHHVRTKQAGRDATSTDTGRRVFPISFRELDTVAGISPPVHHHSLLADNLDGGARYREYIVFHSEYIYPEYLLAYHRYEGDRGPIA